MPATENPNRSTARDAFATALDIKDVIANGDEHGYHVHAPAARAVQDLLVTDLAAQFSEGMAPNKERLRAIFDRKDRMQAHHMLPPSDGECLWMEQLDVAVQHIEGH